MGKSTVTLCIIAWLVTLVAGTPCASNENEPNQNLFPLTIVHINDFHAKFEETLTRGGKECKEPHKSQGKCIAGFARVYTKINELLTMYDSSNAIYLNAGDNVMGSIWYSLLRFDPYKNFMFAKLRPKAMTFGNHEFSAIQQAGEYMQKLNDLDIPVLVCNMDKGGETIVDTIVPSKIIEIGGNRVGIIGVVFDGTHVIAKTGQITFTNSSKAVIQEATNLKSQGIERIIVLSHCGFDVDQKIAAEAGHLIDMIVGAHTHTFLRSADSDRPFDPKDEIAGSYPFIVISNTDNRSIPIVQASAYGKYVGRITVCFNAKGDIASYDGNPEYVNNEVLPDASILEDMKPFQKEIQLKGSEEAGTTSVMLHRDSCRNLECSLGSVIADAYVSAWPKENPIAIIQAGTFREAIPVGKITRKSILNAVPSLSKIDLLQMQGSTLKDVIRESFNLDAEKRTNCLQVSGIKMKLTLNADKTLNTIDSVQVKNKDGEYVDLQDSETYFVAAPDYLADGYDGFKAMKRATSRKSGPEDIQIIFDYIKKRSTIDSVERGRVKICGYNWNCDEDKLIELNDEGFPKET